MKELKNLYSESLKKWNNIYMLYKKGFIIDEFDVHIRTPCSFCKDNNQRNCRDCYECRINEEICDDSGDGGMLGVLIEDVEGLDLGGWILNIIDKLEEGLKNSIE